MLLAAEAPPRGGPRAPPAAAGRAAARPRRRLARPAPRRAAALGAGAPPDDPALVGEPWAIRLQTNERQLAWDAAAARQLVRLFVGRALDLPEGEVRARLAELAALLPGFDAKLHRLRAPLVAELAADTGAVAARLVALREALPGVDVGAAAAGAPWLLSQPPAAELAAAAARVAAALPPGRWAAAVEAEPRLLLADLEGALAELRRLGVKDPAAALAADPASCIGMREAGLPASLAVDDGIASAA
jgi:hypothetical protein